MAKRYYITTPIYYVNSVPHIGTAFTTFASDVNARYMKMRGLEVTLLTGTDENGLKVMEAAQAAGREPMAFVDEISQTFVNCWKELNVEYDDFIRTTEPRHKRTVQAFVEKLKENGYIYTGSYEGWYDVSSETYYKESDLVDGKSPDGNEVRYLKEDNLFFKLSAFGDRLLEHIEAHPEFIVPENRRNEVIAFIKQGLRDVSISRTNNGWGIPFPDDEGRVVYVWFDALINYVSATGWPDSGWETLWPADVQWMGKDILTRFHATLWPAMLLGVGLPLPKQLVGHAWLLMGGEKISKSKGNVVAPGELAAHTVEVSGCKPEIAVDAVRYFLASGMPYENDGNYTEELYFQRFNSDLANDLGNALNRTLAMSHRFGGGSVPSAAPENEVLEAIAKAKSGFEQAMERFALHEAADAAWGLVRFLNKYVDTRAPWALAKNGQGEEMPVLRSMLLALRTAEGLVRPIMPATADAIATQLALPPLTDWSEVGAITTLPEGHALGQPEPIFPRIDLKKLAAEKPKPEAKPKEKVQKESLQVEQIDIDDFKKVQLRVARILEAEKVEGSKKLMKLQVMVGSEKRQVLAGIATAYKPEDIVGMQVILVANLKPAKLMGLESQGMLLAADGPDGEAILLQPESEAPEGTSVH